jgi:ubiquinone/menaquinone biosynthesis C-methylase UbiE/DNA-binding transcriptional ArsR family regulator
MIHGPAVTDSPVYDRLQTLGDETRVRLLLLLAGHEFTVTDLCTALQLPQSTVSRHLRVLADGGWVVSRADGTSRHYRLAELDADAGELWGVVGSRAAETAVSRGDAERARAVRARRRQRSREFFSTAAADWDRMRVELFGSGSDVLPLYGLLDSGWTVADLGAGTGALAARLAPFVKRVIAVDSSAEMLSALEIRVEGIDGVESRRGDLEALPVEDGSCDLAFMLLVLHYIVEPVDALREAWRILKPGGRLILVDMRAHDREEYRTSMGHVWTGFTARQIETWGTEAGFGAVRVEPLSPDPDAAGPLLFLAAMRRS